MNLLLQFKKIANCYFLLIVLLQIVPDLAPPNGAVLSSIPLIFVIGVSMIKDGYEDYKKHKADK